MELTAVQLDRAIGALVGLACGDALGADYEFQPPLPYTTPMKFSSSKTWGRGEWTDDTAMAVCIAQVAAHGHDLRGEEAHDALAQAWFQWSLTAYDIGIQTQRVLGQISRDVSGKALKAASEALHLETGKTAGNGSLMRTAPVALAYLDDLDGLIEATRAVSELTHFDPIAGDACILWNLAIRHCVLNGDFPDLRDFVSYLPQERHDYWLEVIDEAETRESHTFANNGWVVSALQAAWSAIKHAQVPAERPEFGMFAAQHFTIALERAARCGYDTDTVAAIAGQVLGARWGASAIPLTWLRHLNGYPNMTHKDLVELAVLTVRKGQTDSSEWPLCDTMDYSTWPGTSTISQLPSNSRIRCGGYESVKDAFDQLGAAISLCRVGKSDSALPAANHISVLLIDSDEPDTNAHVPFLFHQIAQAIQELLDEGNELLVHCVQAQSRTPSALIAHLMINEGKSFDDAWAEVQQALPSAQPIDTFKSALSGLEPLRHPEDETKVFRFLESGTLQYVSNDSGEVLDLAYSGPFGTLYRHNGAWVETARAGSNFENSITVEIGSSITKVDAQNLVRQCDHWQFTSQNF